MIAMGITMIFSVLPVIQVSLLYRPTALRKKLSSFALYVHLKSLYVHLKSLDPKKAIGYDKIPYRYIVGEPRSTGEIGNYNFFNLCLGAGSRQYCRYTKSPLGIPLLKEIWESSLTIYLYHLNIYRDSLPKLPRPAPVLAS